MQTDYLYPKVCDRENINNWIEQGSTDIVQRASKKTAELFEHHFPEHISEEMDQKIRGLFPFRFDRTPMNFRK